MSEYMRTKRLKVEHIPQVCAFPMCSNTFIPQLSTKQYCSGNCKQRARYMRQNPKVDMACKGCDVDISHMRSNAKWCSDACVMRQRTPELRRKYRLSSKYGITQEQYNNMIERQGNACAICEGTDPKTTHGFWHIDHDHETGNVRGLLCSTCNTGLGSFFDNPNWLRRAAKYVE